MTTERPSIKTTRFLLTSTLLCEVSLLNNLIGPGEPAQIEGSARSPRARTKARFQRPWATQASPSPSPSPTHFPLWHHCNKLGAGSPTHDPRTCFAVQVQLDTRCPRSWIGDAPRGAAGGGGGLSECHTCREAAVPGGCGGVGCRCLDAERTRCIVAPI
jgi:hypothetical protein